MRLTFIVAALIFAGITAQMGQRTETPTIPAFTIMPGDALTRGDIQCDSPYFGQTLYCSIEVAGFHYVGVAYSVEKRQVIRAYYRVEKVPVGNFIAVWGQPDGAMYRRRYTVLYWPGRKVMVMAKVFSPEASHLWVTFGEVRDEYTTWRGFTQEGQ